MISDVVWTTCQTNGADLQCSQVVIEEPCHSMNDRRSSSCNHDQQHSARGHFVRRALCPRSTTSIFWTYNMPKFINMLLLLTQCSLLYTPSNRLYFETYFDVRFGIDASLIFTQHAHHYPNLFWYALHVTNECIIHAAEMCRARDWPTKVFIISTVLHPSFSMLSCIGPALRLHLSICPSVPFTGNWRTNTSNFISDERFTTQKPFKLEQRRTLNTGPLRGGGPRCPNFLYLVINAPVRPSLPNLQ